MTRQQDRVEAEAGEAVAFTVVAAFMAAEASVVEDFTAAVSAAAECEWVADALSAPGPVSPVHIQGPHIEAAGHMHIADMPAAVHA